MAVERVDPTSQITAPRSIPMGYPTDETAAAAQGIVRLVVRGIVALALVMAALMAFGFWLGSRLGG